MLEQAFALSHHLMQRKRCSTSSYQFWRALKFEREKRSFSAVVNVHGTLSARHDFTPTNNNIVIQIASSLAIAKASMNDTEGAIEHASQVVKASVKTLQELDESLLPRLNGKDVSTLEQTLSRMTTL